MNIDELETEVKYKGGGWFQIKEYLHKNKGIYYTYKIKGKKQVEEKIEYIKQRRTIKTMKQYLVSRTDDYGDNEYDAFVIVAENKESAIAMAKKESGGEFTAKEIKTNEECIVLGSFNAG